MTRQGPVAGVRDAEVTIVGGGAVGCAVAYVLSRAGYRDIQVLEQGELAGATSGQAAGLVGQVRASKERCRLAMASVAEYSDRAGDRLHRGLAPDRQCADSDDRPARRRVPGAGRGGAVSWA